MRFVATLFLGMLLLTGGLKADERPLLMLDTGGHMAMIHNVAFTPDGKQLISAADDKVVRVWDVATGKTVRTIRGESAPGNAGKIYSMALSPDGKWLAVGGYLANFVGGKPRSDEDAHKIRLYDFASGRLVALLAGHTNVVFGLAFSPDGRHLISGSGDGDYTAIIWDVETRQLKHSLRGHGGTIYALGFSPDGQRAVTGSEDRLLRQWSVADGRELAIMEGHGDGVHSLAVLPDGSIASGDLSGEIRLWDGKTGVLRKVLVREGPAVGSLSASPDGKLLLSSCARGTPCLERVFEIASGKQIAQHQINENIVLATAISPDGRWAASGGGDNHDIHIWDLRTGKRRIGADGQPLTLGGTGRSVWAAGFSADGRQIAWGNSWTQHDPKNGYGPLEYAFALPAADTTALAGPRPLEAGAAATFRRAMPQYGGWSLRSATGGNDGLDAILNIQLNGETTAAIVRGNSDGLDHRAYSFTPDGETIVTGGMSGTLAAYSRAGNKLGEFVGHEGDIWGVVPSPDGRYLLSSANDQTVRLWNLKTRELLVTLFHGKDGEWAMWTPQGYYAASGPGAELIGWQLNHGLAHEADFINAAQLRKTLNRPDIVSRAIQLVSADAAVKEAYGTNFRVADLLTKPVPRFRIVSPAPNAALHGGVAGVKVVLEPTPDPVKTIRIQINGRQIAEEMPAQGGGFAPGPQEFAVPLAKGLNTIRLTAVNDTGETPAEVAVTLADAGGLDKRGTLYILAVGADKYPNLGKACRELDGVTPKACDLRMAGADAKSFADTITTRLGPSHDRVVSRVLVNGAANPADAPTAGNILDALGELRNAEPFDTIAMFLSGHGTNDGPTYKFLATDAAFANGALRNSTIVPWANFQLALETAKGRRILFLDTCHSGNSYNQRLGNDAYQANIIVYSAARWDQEAMERSDLGHGLFTYAIVEGLNGAARNKAGEVRAEGLRDYLHVRVNELARQIKHQQEPQYFRGRDAENYVLVRDE